MLADKDIKSVVDLLKPTVLHWKIAELNVPRAAPIQQLNDALQGQTIQQFGNIKEAFKSALEQTNNNQLILACGSFIL